MSKIKIYTIPYCPFCFKIKNLMKKKKIIFEEIDLSIKPEKFDEMISKKRARIYIWLFVYIVCLNKARNNLTSC